MKIIDKINALPEDKKFFSYEYFPPKTDAGVLNLFDRIDRMARTEPLFCDCTWGAGGSTSDLTLEICTTVQKFFGMDIMMHLTCTNMSVALLYEALKQAKDAGIMNILALRGDPPAGKEWTKTEDGFSNAVDLVKFIRREYGDFFGIGVAGYPEGHIESESYQKDLEYLKEKCDAGADFIVTQLFYNVDHFFKWEKDCRAIGITVPIVPGIMPIQNFGGFKRMTGFCKTDVPQEITDALEAIKEDDVKVKAYGIEQAVGMCKKMLEAELDTPIRGCHIYTLNLEKSATGIIKGLGMYSEDKAVRALPWRPSTMSPRRTAEETVRPIFWANRPRSYMARSMEWDEFPNGRWGKSSSAAFGSLSDNYLARLDRNGPKNKEGCVKLWGTPTTLGDVSSLFVSFCKGTIDRLPWSETPGLDGESTLIDAKLVGLNEKGVLTVNSQPSVNGVDSTDAAVGWGGAGGYIYQKGYLEFFASPEVVAKIVEACKGQPSLTFQALNQAGDSKTNCEDAAVNAVTWGVFPGKEVVQPTVVDSESFKIWKDEAFGLWKTWAEVYEEGSESANVLSNVYDTYYLMNIVENDYVKGDVFSIFETVDWEGIVPPLPAAEEAEAPADKRPMTPGS